jgi:glutamate-1-semialdehyde 2,1-aminomutase
MIPLAEVLAKQLAAVFTRHNAPWCVTQIGARVEFQFSAQPPRTGREAEQAFNDRLERCIHLYLLNRGVMITPFHNMMLVCPDTTLADVARLAQTLDSCLADLSSQ